MNVCDKSILGEASAAVEARRERYGESTSHHALTAKLWGDYLGREVTAAEVAMLMVLDKVARQRNDPTYRDNYVDIAGYASCAADNAGVNS